MKKYKEISGFQMCLQHMADAIFKGGNKTASLQRQNNRCNFVCSFLKVIVAYSRLRVGTSVILVLLNVKAGICDCAIKVSAAGCTPFRQTHQTGPITQCVKCFEKYKL